MLENEDVNSYLTNQLTQLSSLIDRHEETYKKMLVLKDTSIIYDTRNLGDGETLFFRIGMLKWQGAWRLCHNVSTEEELIEDMQWRPLTDSRVTERLNAVRHLDKLREAILQEKRRMIPEIEDAIELLARSLEEVEVNNAEDS